MADTLETLEIEVKHKASGAADEISRLSEAIGKLSKSLSAIPQTGTKVQAAATKTAKGIKEVSSAAKKAQKPLSNFIASLKRIAFYRIIRSIIKSITQAFQEGLQWAYQFSAGIDGEGNRFAQALDRMKSAGSQMKAQLGSAFISLLAVIEPIVNRIIAIVTKVADAIAQLFSAFTGSTYLKASAVSEKFADTMKSGGKAAKEWKNQLLGFDEINRLNEPSNGGGGGGTSEIDPSQRFQDTPIADFYKRIRDAVKSGDWHGIAAIISGKIKDALSRAVEVIKGFDFGAFARNVFGGIAEFLDGFQIGGIMQKLSELLISILNGLADFINGATDSNLISSLGNFFERAFSGIDVDGILIAVSNLLLTIVLNIPIILMRFVAMVADVISRIFKSVGMDSVAGFFNGISEKIKDAATFLKENFVDPIIDCVKRLLGIHSPSTVFAGIGSEIVNGLKLGIQNAWSGVETLLSSLFGGLISWCQQAHGWIQDVLDGIGLIGNGGSFFGGHITIGTPQFASGGYPDAGQLFVANETGAGAELVGNIGGRTAVASNNDILEGIRQGVYDAVLAANGNGNNDVSVRVFLDSKEIKAGQQRLNRAWGV